MDYTDEEVLKLLKRELALEIRRELRKEFETIHLSGNLAKTINFRKKRNGDYVLTIPAKCYDINTYKKTGAIVYNEKGSYASIVNKTGGFSGKHTNFAKTRVMKAIQKWAKNYNFNIKIGE